MLCAPILKGTFGPDESIKSFIKPSSRINYFPRFFLYLVHALRLLLSEKKLIEIWFYKNAIKVSKGLSRRRESAGSWMPAECEKHRVMNVFHFADIRNKCATELESLLHSPRCSVSYPLIFCNALLFYGFQWLYHGVSFAVFGRGSRGRMAIRIRGRRLTRNHQVRQESKPTILST